MPSTLASKYSAPTPPMARKMITQKLEHDSRNEYTVLPGAVHRHGELAEDGAFPSIVYNHSNHHQSRASDALLFHSASIVGSSIRPCRRHAAVATSERGARRARQMRRWARCRRRHLGGLALLHMRASAGACPTSCTAESLRS